MLHSARLKRPQLLVLTNPTDEDPPKPTDAQFFYMVMIFLMFLSARLGC